MSVITAEGRQRIRDIRRGATMRQLYRDPRLAALPTHQRVTLSELKLIGRDLYNDIRQRGVMLPDGTVNPAVEAHRKNAQTQLHSLQV